MTKIIINERVQEAMDAIMNGGYECAEWCLSGHEKEHLVHSMVVAGLSMRKKNVNSFRCSSEYILRSCLLMNGGTTNRTVQPILGQLQHCLKKSLMFFGK